MTMTETTDLRRLPKGQRIDPATRRTIGEALRHAYLAGASLRAIASDTGRSYGWVHKTLTIVGCELRSRGGSRRRAA